MDTANERVLKIAKSVLEQLDIEQVLRRVLEAACDLTDARYAALGVLDASGTTLARFLTVGIDEPTHRAIGELPTGRGVLGELIRSPAPLRLADVASHPYSYGFPVGHPPMHTFLGVPIAVNDLPYGNLYLTEKQGGREFTEADEHAVIELAEFAGLAIDHARRYTSSEDQRAQLEQTVQALDATIQIGRALSGETDLGAILELVAKRGRALVGARVLLIELLDGTELEVAAGAGELPTGVLGQRVDLEGTVASAALRGGRTQKLSDQLNRARFEQHGAGQLGIGGEDGLVVPLIFHGRPYGVLIVIDHLDEGGFTTEHQRLLESFAASAASAVATAQSAADEGRRQRVAAAEAERGRWARELHDETLQALGGVRLVLSGARRRGGEEAMGEAIDAALEQLDLDITSLRALITELRPAALDQLGLEPALLALIDRASRSGLDVDARIVLAHEAGTAEERLDEEIETGIYRIVQEALANASKHGSATSASVTVVESDGRVEVTVRDDGVGFDPAARTSGFGLTGMGERAQLLGGELTIESAPDRGAAVSITVSARHRAGGEASAPSSSVASTA